MEQADGISLCDFTRPIALAQLYRTRCAQLPTACGVYVVLRSCAGVPEFLFKSDAGWFKGQNPTYPAEVVRANWIPAATVVYVGKAAGQKGFRARVRQLVDFGFGKPVGHRGGRLLWHLADFGELQLCWRECPGSRADSVETSMIADFRAVHCANPFANMAK